MNHPLPSHFTSLLTLVVLMMMGTVGVPRLAITGKKKDHVRIRASHCRLYCYSPCPHAQASRLRTSVSTIAHWAEELFFRFRVQHTRTALSTVQQATAWMMNDQTATTTVPALFPCLPVVKCTKKELLLIDLKLSNQPLHLMMDGIDSFPVE